MKRRSIEALVVFAMVALLLAALSSHDRKAKKTDSSKPKISSPTSKAGSFFWSVQDSDFRYYFELYDNGEWYALLCARGSMPGNYLAQGEVSRENVQSFFRTLEGKGVWRLRDTGTTCYSPASASLQFTYDSKSHEVNNYLMGENPTMDEFLFQDLPGTELGKLRYRRTHGSVPDFGYSEIHNWPFHRERIQTSLWYHDNFLSRQVEYSELLEREDLIFFFQRIGGHTIDFAVYRDSKRGLRYEFSTPFPDDRVKVSGEVSRADWNQLLTILSALEFSELSIENNNGHDMDYHSVYLRTKNDPVYYQWYGYNDLNGPEVKLTETIFHWSVYQEAMKKL